MRTVLYTYCPTFNTRHMYLTGDYTLTSSCVFHVLISSTFVLDLYGLMQRILYVIYVTIYCKFTAPLVKNHFISTGTLYGVSYMYTS